jgi:hypothetical protein
LMNLLEEEGIGMLCRAHHPHDSSITTSRMTVSTVSKTQRAKLPVVSTANKSNEVMQPQQRRRG